MKEGKKELKEPERDNTYESDIAFVLQRMNENLDIFVEQYPHVSKEYHYGPEENCLWTSSFFIGMCFLAYEVTGDKKYIKHEKSYLDSFRDRIENRKYISHDLGFLYTLSCVADYKTTGNKDAAFIAREAAAVLAERYNERGKYIQAWGDIGIKYPDVKIIIDTMLNLPLLYWTAEPEKVTIARNHAITAGKYLIRPDFTSYHTYLMNPDTGEAVSGKTHQGYADESTWARGQAWAVYGFALSYRYTKEKEFLEIAKKTAEVFIENLPKDDVPYWDFSFNDEKPDIRDTSAAAIFVCGLLELSHYVDALSGNRYLQIVEKIMTSLREHYTTKDIKGANGVLSDGMYHRNDGAEESVIWGDYFYFEALVRLTRTWNPYW